MAEDDKRTRKTAAAVKAPAAHGKASRQPAAHAQPRPARPQRQQAPEIPAEWRKAIEDIVASAIARDHVDGKPYEERAKELRVMLGSYVPRARWALHAAFGHPPDVTSCRCRSYALLHIDAVELSFVKRMPVEALYTYACAEFDSYMDNLQ